MKRFCESPRPRVQLDARSTSDQMNDKVRLIDIVHVVFAKVREDVGIGIGNFSFFGHRDVPRICHDSHRISPFVSGGGISSMVSPRAPYAAGIGASRPAYRGSDSGARAAYRAAIAAPLLRRIRG